MIDRGKRTLLGVNVDAVDLDAAVDRIAFHAEQRRPYLVSALAVHGVIEARHDPQLRSALNRFDVVLPDGQAVVWALNALHGVDLRQKVPGPTVMDALLARAADVRLPVFFYGSTPETLAGMRRELERRHGDRIEVHTRPSSFGPADRGALRAIAAQINGSGARLCFVGLGCPRQERFVAALGGSLTMPSLAVGAGFDYLAGSITRAPECLQRSGLEWAYRLAQEPRRLAGRYLTTNSEFVLAVARQLVAQRLGRDEGAVDAAPSAPWTVVDA